MLPKFKSKVFLAPMSGVSDAAFRLMCSRLGAGLTTTELTSVHSIVAKEKELSLKSQDITEFVQFSKEENPKSIQLFGSDINLICKAAQIVEPFFDLIDFNMGCPADHITQQMAGAALLAKPEHVEKLFSKLVSSVNKPVTLKVRAGISSDSCYLFKNIAKIAVNCGVEMVALHARTLKQGYSGTAKWEWIKELKESVNVPVIGNGDIKKPEDAKQMMQETGCDYVMIGRAAMGRPYMIKQTIDFLEKGKYAAVNSDEGIEYFYQYLELAKDFHINYARIKEHAQWYTHGMQGAPELRNKLSTAKTIEEIKKIFEERKR